MQYGPQYYLQTYLSMTSGNWVTKLYILGLSLYFIVALTAQRFRFPAYKPAFRPGLFAFSAFITKHNSLARETAYLHAFSEEKGSFPKADKKNFPASWIPIGKPFLAILRFKNHPRLLQTFEQPQEETFPFAAIFVYLYYRAVRRLNTRKPMNQSDKSLFVIQPCFLQSQARRNFGRYSRKISWKEMEGSYQSQHSPSKLRVIGQESTPRSIYQGISQASVQINSTVELLCISSFLRKLFCSVLNQRLLDHIKLLDIPNKS